MCEKIEEIQKLWKPDDGDYFYGYEWADLKKYYDKEGNHQISKNVSKLATKEIHLLYFSGDDYESCFPIGEDIGYENQKPDLTKSFWLPTQEQLQEMVFTENDFYDNLIEFTKFIDTEYCYFAERNDNYENFDELWLCYVMKEKYNKTWTGKIWK